MTASDFSERLSDQHWRLNNLYAFRDRDGLRRTFKMNSAQEELFSKLHSRNIILKARQLGFTTFIQIFMLDLALFHPDTTCGVIAHTEDAAKKIFREKIKYVYDNLDPAIKRRIRVVTSNASELILSNGSSITCATSLRSGTYNALHISELGRTAAHYPERAVEIITGSIPTLSSTAVAFIESTAEGQQGIFFDLCQDAESAHNRGDELDRRAWKFHFHPWWAEPEYVADPRLNTIPQSFDKYFADLQRDHGISLTSEQKAFYALEHKTYGNQMKREYPAVPGEAFEAVIEGAYYADIIADLERAGRVTDVPHNPALQVECWFDLGWSDKTAIWFVQRDVASLKVIDFYQNSKQALPHYVEIIAKKGRELGYRYSRFVGPHDSAVHSLETGQTRTQFLQSQGLTPWIATPKIANVMDGIEKVRMTLPVCIFDKTMTSEGLKCLRTYRAEFDSNKGVFKSQPRHDWASDAADAFRTGVMAPVPYSTSSVQMPVVRRA